MKKRIIIIVLAFSMTALAIKLYSPVNKTWRSCRILSTFIEHIKHSEWNEAQAMLETDPTSFRIEDEKVLYWNSDDTDHMSSARTNFWKTLDYYLTDGHLGDKVIFHGSSDSEYALLKDGKITFVKRP